MAGTNDSREFDYIPSYVKPTHEYGKQLGDEFHAPIVKELLASYARFTQRGVTLAGGQGVLPTGCVLARKTTDGKYYAYSAAGSTGLNVALGLLRDARDTSPGGVATDCLGNLVISGIVDLGQVSGTDTQSLVLSTGGGVGQGIQGVLGATVTGAVQQLNGRIDTVNQLFVF